MKAKRSGCGANAWHTIAAVLIAAGAACPALNASDIGGEVVPPVCSYQSNGAPTTGDPQACAETFRIAAVSGGPGDTTMLSPTNNSDPWMLTETLGTEPLTLRFTGTFGPYVPIPSDPLVRGDPTGSGHVLARWFTVSVRNTSHVPWGAFRFELRSNPNLPSDDEDTLSFGEWLSSTILYGPPFSPDFAHVNAEDFDFDAFGSDVLLFSAGSVRPNEVADFHFVISSNSAADIYLIQQPVPEPAPVGMIGIGLCAVVLKRLYSVLRG